MSLYGTRRRAAPKDALAPWLREFLLDGTWPEEGSDESGELFEALYCGRGLGALLTDAWARHGEALVAEVAHETPGERPYYWWRHVLKHEEWTDAAERYRDAQGPYGDLNSIMAWLHDRRREKPAAYLRRLGHLLPGEEDRIPAVAFEAYTDDEIDAYDREKHGAAFIPRSERVRA